MTDTSREALVKRLAEQWAALDPADPYRDDVGLAVHMLDADKRENVPTTRELNADEKAELLAAGVTGEFVRVLAFNDRPACSQQVAVPEPLSDAAIEDIWMIAREANDFPEVFARAIEAAHGIARGAKP